jgi:RNA polymerase sigma-70 factor (family 1)
MDSSTPHIDRELFLQIANGDEMAFREIFNKFGPVLHRFALNIIKNEAIAREIVQEVFLKVWLKRESLPVIEKPASWLYRVASNLSLTHLRRQHIEEKVLNSIQEKELFHENPILNDLSAKHLQGVINQAVYELPPQRQRIFRMSKESGLSRKEIARELDLSENTVRNQLAISLRSIQSFIQRDSDNFISILFILIISAI